MSHGQKSCSHAAAGMPGPPDGESAGHQESPGGGHGAAAPKKKVVGFGYVIDAVELFVEKMWCTMNGMNEHGGRVYRLFRVYWPESRSSDEANALFTTTLARLLAEVIHRLSLKFGHQPYAACPVNGKDVSNEQARRVLVLPPCCARGLEGLLRFAKSGAQGLSDLELMKSAIFIWNEKNRPSSIAEEKLHAEQRYAASSHGDRSSSSFAKQSAATLACMVTKTYYEKGGRTLSLKPKIIMQAYRASTASRPILRRDKAVGNAQFKYIAEKMAATKDCR